MVYVYTTRDSDSDHMLFDIVFILFSRNRGVFEFIWGHIASFGTEMGWNTDSEKIS